MSKKFVLNLAWCMFWFAFVLAIIPCFGTYTLKKWIQLELTAVWLCIFSLLIRLDAAADNLGVLFDRVAKNRRKMDSIDEDVEHLFETLLPDYVPTADYTLFAANVEVSTPELRA